jgi:hypothetical protein
MLDLISLTGINLLDDISAFTLSIIPLFGRSVNLRVRTG